MIKNIQNARYAEGGSTITQQLIKNLALTREKTIERKLKEFLLALRLETILSKEEILERYLKIFSFIPCFLLFIISVNTQCNI